MINDDYNALIGAKLIRISFGIYCIQLFFEQNIRITHANTLVLKNNVTGKTETWEDTNGKGCICLRFLLEETITSYDMNDRGDITLNFSNDHTVTLYNDITVPEAYLLWINNSLYLSGDNIDRKYFND